MSFSKLNEGKGNELLLRNYGKAYACFCVYLETESYFQVRGGMESSIKLDNDLGL